MTRPLVSVCIPTYKGADFIRETIQSVLDQSLQDFEILVFDDNSPDITEEICQSFRDGRIQYTRNNTNLGPQGNWNLCLKKASGKFYKLLPHDDLLTPFCLAEQVDAMDADPDIALVFGSRTIINEQGKTLMARSPLGAHPITIDGKSLVRRCITSGSNIIGEPGNGLIRTNLIKAIGDYDDTHGYTIDLDYWFRALAHGHAHYTATIASAFRIHDNSWSAEIGKHQHRDFAGTIDKFGEMPGYEIGPLIKTIGKLRSRANMHARRLIFKKFASS